MRGRGHTAVCVPSREPRRGNSGSAGRIRGRASRPSRHPHSRHHSATRSSGCGQRWRRSSKLSPHKRWALGTAGARRALMVGSRRVTTEDHAWRPSPPAPHPRERPPDPPVGGIPELSNDLRELRVCPGGINDLWNVRVAGCPDTGSKTVTAPRGSVLNAATPGELG